jgi:hypothetical protein
MSIRTLLCWHRWKIIEEWTLVLCRIVDDKPVGKRIYMCCEKCRLIRKQDIQ